MYWQNKAYEIAKEGIFNIEGLTPIDSVYSTNLFKVLEYISLDSANKKYAYELQEMAHKDSVAKSRRKR
jgi:hypothetical protein